MDNPKEKYSVYLSDDTYELITSLYKLDACKTKSNFIERAVRFYAGYISSDKSVDYLSTAVSDSVERKLGSFENRMAKMLFKYSVEQAIMMNVIAAYHKVDKPQLDRLRGQCVEEIKRTKGRFDFNDAMDWQHGDDNE